MSAPPYKEIDESVDCGEMPLIPANTYSVPAQQGSSTAATAATESGAASPVAPQKLAVGPKSHIVVCPYCSATVRTRVDHTTNTRTHLVALLCCHVCCFCWCLPYCMDSTRNVDHYCPSKLCGRFLGTYKK